LSERKKERKKERKESKKEYVFVTVKERSRLTLKLLWRGERGEKRKMVSIRTNLPSVECVGPYLIPWEG